MDETGKFEEELLETALMRGCEAAEICFDATESFSAKALEQQLDGYESSRRCGIGLRVVVNHKNGYAYTEAFEDAGSLVARAMDNAAVIGKDEESPMNGKKDYVAVTRPPEPLCDLSPREKIDLAMKMERDTKAADPHVFQTPYCYIETGVHTRRLRNTLGLSAMFTSRTGAALLQAAVRDGKETHDAFDVATGTEAPDVERLAARVVARAVKRFGAASAPAGEYRVLIDKRAMCDLLGAFSPMFSAEDVQKGLSAFAGKLGETVAPDCVTLTDDPLYEKNPRPFDAEGTPSVAKNVVENGRLVTFLHNLKTARKDGVAPTSNASRASAASPVSVAPTNLYLRPGTDDFDALLKALGDGLLVTEVSGLHAGLSTVSGDFSLLSEGFLVKDGAIARPVEQITVAGSFLSLLRDVERVGADLYFGAPAATLIGSPSVLVKKLTISGSEQ